MEGFSHFGSTDVEKGFVYTAVGHKSVDPKVRGNLIKACAK